MLEKLERKRSGAGIPISIAVHAAVIGLLLLPAAPKETAPEPRDEVRVRIGPRPQPATPIGRGETAVRPKKHHSHWMEPPRATPPAQAAEPVKPDEPEAVAEADEPDGPETADAREGPGGPAGNGTGIAGVETGGGAAIPEPRAFEDSMTPPRLIAGPSPRYTPQALEHEIEGTMKVRCRVHLDGSVSECQVVKSVPFMDRAVIDALEQRRYTPAIANGRPVEVDYTFNVQLRLPN